MSPSLNQMIEWARGELSLSPVQGLTISDLFHRLDKYTLSGPDVPPPDGATKNLLWQALVAREDLYLGDGKSALALKKLSLDDVLDLGLGERRIKLLVAAEADQASAPDAQVLGAGVYPPSRAAVLRQTPQPTEWNALNPPEPRGLEAIVHPVSGDAVINETRVPSLDQSHEAPEPKRQGRPPKQPSHQPDSKTAQTPIAEASVRSRRSISSAAVGSPQSVPLDHSSSSSSRQVTPIWLTPTEDNRSSGPTQPSGSIPALKRGRLSRTSAIKRATFTPQEEVQREEDDAKIEAGIPGVYINPTVSQPPRERAGIKAKNRIVAVFKSAKLKIPQWLDARKGTWKDTLAKRTGTDLALLDHTPEANITPTSQSMPLKRKGLHDTPDNSRSRLDLDGAQPAKKFAGPQIYNQNAASYTRQLLPTPPPPSNNFLPQYPILISGPPVHPKPSGLAAVAAQQSSHFGAQPSYQPAASNPVVAGNMPQKPAYKSPYSFNPAPAAPLTSLPGTTPTHFSPYQHTHLPSEPISLQMQSLTSSIPALRTEYPRISFGPVLTPNTPPLQEHGARSKAFVLPIPDYSPNIEGTLDGKRKYAHADADEPNKRYKTTPVMSTRYPPILGNGAPTPQAFFSTAPKEPSLEDILRQQDEEKKIEAQRERELQDRLSAAERAEVPEHLTRLAAEYDNSVGNLILSRDQSTLYFVSLDRPSPEDHVLVLPVSMIIGNPIVSIAGSKPMELRIKSKDETNIESTHCFNVGQTILARTTADVMRSKLVLAKLSIPVTKASSTHGSDDDFEAPQIDAPRPFSCETCNKTFKNKVGKIYHLTKSQTTCNPAFDPSTERRSGGRKPKKKVTVVRPPKNKRQRSAENEPVENEEENVLGNEQSDGNSTDSIDSIIEWAEKASRPQTRSTASRRNKDASSPPGEEYPALSFYSNEDGSNDGSDHTSDDEFQNVDDDAYLSEETTAQKRKRNMQETWARAKAMGGKTLAGLGKKNGLQAGATASLQAGIAGSSQVGTKTFHNEPPSSNALKKVRIPLTEQEKERRAIKAAHKEQCWDTALSYLPNAETGSWDRQPERAKKSHRKPVRRRELPEPVTYMQNEDGAWSIRPFGHGVKPIYARPARRADGNPFLPQYLERIGNGFRPVIIPTKNRLYLPAVPSKVLMRGTSDNLSPPAVVTEDISKSERPRRRQRRRISISSEDGEDGEFKVRISKLTGKPVRAYRKEKDRDLTAGTFKPNGGLGWSHALDPMKLSPAKGKLCNPGLDSLPASFGLEFPPATNNQHPPSNIAGVESNKSIRKIIAPMFSLVDILADISPIEAPDHSQPRIFSNIQAVEKWEQGRGCDLLCSGTTRPDYRWINHTAESPDGAIDLQHVKISWDNHRSFDMVTIPYAELDELEDITLFDAPHAPPPPPELSAQPAPLVPQYRVPRSSLKPASKIARDLRELHKGWPTRRLTALSTDLAGVGDSPEQVAKEFGAQIAQAPTTSRTRNGGSYMSAADETRLIVGVCVLRTLTGGLDQNIDWVLVATLFDRFSMNFLTKRWTTLFQKKRLVIEKLMGDFQEAFLPAYEKGEVPPINYDKLVEYNWPWLVDWAMKKVDLTLGTKAIDLPDTRERLQKLYHIKENNFQNARQDGYFSLTYPVYRRMELASSVPNTLPSIGQPEPKRADDMEISTLMLVKSWVRAAALTQDDAWDPIIMKRKLKTLNDPRRQDRKGNDPVVKTLVDQAAEILRNDKVLMQRNRGRTGPNRTYEPTDAFFSGLRKHLTVKQFIDAANFKYYLDQAFSSGKECVRSDYMANEGTLMCVTQLQAYGRIRLKAVGVPMNKFGLMDGGYETRKIPKEKFRFDMDIYPTARYVYDSNNEIMHRLKRTKPPRGSELGELPVWYGIGDELIPDLWYKVLVAFVGIIALRAGINIESLKMVFHPTLEGWEIRRLIEWGSEYGLLEPVHALVDGWTTGEWWWLIIGWCCSGEI